jgi:hypothetical protein
MACIFWSLNCEKKTKKKVKTPLGVQPNMAYISWSLNYEKKTKKKAPQIFVWLEEEF